MKYLDDTNTCHKIHFIDSSVKEEKAFIEDPPEHCMMFGAIKEDINTFWEVQGKQGHI